MGRAAGIFRMALVLLACLPLFLAGCGTSPATKPAKVRKPASSQRISGDWYRVKKGDTLWSVSWRAGVDYRTLARWNGLKSPYTIYPGQLLRLRPPRTATGRSKGKGAVAGGASRRHSAAPSGRSTRPATGGRERGSTGKSAPVRMRWQWPLEGRVVSSFHAGDPERNGIKIAGRRGQKVLAAESGTVVYSGSGLIGYGQLIIIKHNNEFLSAYGHNSRLLVKEGQRVKRGQHIADLGVDRAGRAWLHFEIRRFGRPVNPLSYLPGG